MNHHRNQPQKLLSSPFLLRYLLKEAAEAELLNTKGCLSSICG
jgi:hypothetical protein